jgi:putative addiction module killer protein
VLKPGNYKVLAFHLEPEKSPYLDWFRTLDTTTKGRVFDRVQRLAAGQFGDYKKIDRSLYELRFFFGPGYRIYFGEHRGNIIILLTGGSKTSQTRDINKAKQYWKIYQEDNP